MINVTWIALLQKSTYSRYFSISRGENIAPTCRERKSDNGRFPSAQSVVRYVKIADYSLSMLEEAPVALA